MVSVISKALKSPISGLFSELTGRRRGSTYQMKGYAELGQIILFASKREHKQAAKALRNEFGDLLRPENLYDFAKWAITNYPAKHQALILWNHGSGIEDPHIWGKVYSSRASAILACFKYPF